MKKSRLNSFRSNDKGKSPFQSPSEDSSLRVMSGNEISEPYMTELSFAPVHIKDERLDDETSEELSSTIQFHQSPVVVSASQLKGDCSHILNAGKVTIADQVETISNHRSVLVTNNSSSTKGLSNHTIIPISQGVSFSSAGLTLSNMNSLTADNNLVPSTLSSTIMNQPLQVYQSTSYGNCDNTLESQSNSGQTFLLTSPNSMLTSNQIMSQGQVFIQGDELVSVSLPTTVANSYTLSSTDAHFGSGMSVIQSSHGVNAASRRLIIHPNQANSADISNPIVSTHNGHYLIQVGNSLSSISTNSNLSINNKGHIVIRSGVSKNKADNDDALDSVPKDGIFRVIIPEGTTKLPKPVHPVKIIDSGEEAIRKHVQINLSNRSTYSPTKLANLEPVTTQPAKIQLDEKPLVSPHRKLYECTNCCSKFMKALYLRMHMRSCKKPEVKLEKSPLYMCSFCKTTVKIKSHINIHFEKCKSCPFAMKEAAEKREMEINEDDIPPSKRAKLMELDSSLEQAIQYKCQDCDRTFNKERQYTSHVKRCTKVSVHDMSALKMETMVESINDEDHDFSEDPFADPPPFPPPSTTKRGRGGGGRRGRPPGRMPNAAQKAAQKSNTLFEGEKLEATYSGLIVADNENLVRSTTGLAHTLQLSLETSLLEGHPQPCALVSDSKGIRSREKPPQAWSLVCSLCQKMFLTKVALANHVIEYHGEELKTTANILQGKSKENDFFRCPVCNLHYLSGQHFLEHLVMQHTNKLQECHKALQCQTASFICSLCSLVLLTKNLLLEHLSLEHLEELEKIQASMLYTRKRKHKQIGDSSENADNTVPKTETSPIQECLPEDWKYEDENILECRYCGEESESLELLKSHYINCHGVETDASGDIVDEGVDVDIRIKDTHALVKLADGKISDSHLPPKTVLIRRKPKQSWQCQSCQQIFTRQAVWLKHVRDTCPSLNTSKENNKSSTRECRFYCNEPECCQLAFLQFKSLVKHKEEVHSIIIKKERKVFENLASFYQWLSLEEQKENLHFIRDSARIEKNNVRLIQMVCHRFHTAKNDQSKDKEDSDFGKPTKKRWYVRMQKENNCYARIFLRSEFDYSRNDYDGETQVIYYPEHFHNGIEDSPELLESMREKYPHTKHPNSKGNGAFDGDSGSSQGIDSPGDMFMEDSESSGITADPLNVDDSSQLLECTPSTSSAVIFSDNGNTTSTMNKVSMLSAHSNTSRESRLILSHNSVDTHTSNSGLILENNGETRFVIPSRMREGNIEQKAILVDGGDSNTFMVMDVDHRDGDTEQELSEEYVLPADESEWTKLFDVLSERISSGELFGEEKKEAENLISFRNLLPITSIHQQVDIFQRMCSLTNIESS